MIYVTVSEISNSSLAFMLYLQKDKQSLNPLWISLWTIEARTIITLLWLCNWPNILTKAIAWRQSWVSTQSRFGLVLKISGKPSHRSPGLLLIIQFDNDRPGHVRDCESETVTKFNWILFINRVLSNITLCCVEESILNCTIEIFWWTCYCIAKAKKGNPSVMSRSINNPYIILLNDISRLFKNCLHEKLRRASS